MASSLSLPQGAVSLPCFCRGRAAGPTRKARRRELGSNAQRAHQMKDLGGCAPAGVAVCWDVTAPAVAVPPQRDWDPRGSRWWSSTCRQPGVLGPAGGLSREQAETFPFAPAAHWGVGGLRQVLALGSLGHLLSGGIIKCKTE